MADNAMAGKRPTTIAAYIKAAPTAGQPHLHQMYAILKSVAPDATETIKWGTPFFVEPRFLFAFSAHKSHINFAPGTAVLEVFREALAEHQTTSNFLQIPYTRPIPEALIRKMAEYRCKIVNENRDDSFW